MQTYLRILLIVLFSSLCIFCSLQVAFCLFWSLYFILEASSRCLCSLLICATGAPHGLLLGEVCWWSAPPYGDLSVPLTRLASCPEKESLLCSLDRKVWRSMSPPGGCMGSGRGHLCQPHSLVLSPAVPGQTPPPTFPLSS